MPPRKRVTEQINPGNFTSSSSTPTTEDQTWGYLASGGEEDYYWRRISDNPYQKDLIPSTYLEVHNLCYEAWNSNPIASAIIEMSTSFVLGKGVTIAARNPRVQAVLMDFWNDEKNRMEDRVYGIYTELCLYGEQFIRFYVNKYDGSVYIRQIDPSFIDQIETDPEDIETPLRFHRRPLSQITSTATPEPIPAFDPKHPQDTEGIWYKAGTEVVHFAINKVSNAKRGKSDLATLIPWLRRYKDWLTDRVRINKYKTAFLYDVKLQGADKKTIDRKKMDYAYPPEPGSVLIHNEAETWTAVQPNINASDAKEDGRAIKLMIAIGAGLPEHYLGDGSNGNRATAAEMSMPTLLKFERRQKTMRYILTCILDRVIDEAKRVGKIGPRINTGYDLLFPEIDVSDMQNGAHGLFYLAQALGMAKGQGWLSDETAMKLLFQFTGDEIDIHEELAKVAASRSPLPPAGGDVSQ